MKQNTPNKSAERWLFAACLIAAILASGCSDKKHPVPTREAAVRTLKHNGTVTIREGAETHTICHMKDLPLNGFTVVGITVNDNEEFGDEDLQAFKHLITIRRLSLDGTSVSDQSRDVYSTLFNLRHLDLSDTNISDTTLQALSSLSNLKELYLSGTETTAAGLDHITTLSSLQLIDLTNTNTTPRDLKPLIALYNLQEIRMIGETERLLPASLFQQKLPMCRFTTTEATP